MMACWAAGVEAVDPAEKPARRADGERGDGGERRHPRDHDAAQADARQERDERTEVHQAGNRTEVLFADLHFFGEGLNHGFRLGSAFAVG